MWPTQCVCGCEDPPRQLSFPFPLRPAGLNPLRFLVKPWIRYIIWVRLNKWRCNHKRQKWSPVPKWTYCKSHWHSLCWKSSAVVRWKEKRKEIRYLWPVSVSVWKQKIQKSFLFAISIFLPGSWRFAITLPATLAAGISGGLWVGGDTDSLIHLPGVTCRRFAAEPHWGSGREWLGLSATYALTTNPMLTATAELPPGHFGRSGSPLSCIVLRRQFKWKSKSCKKCCLN